MMTNGVIGTHRVASLCLIVVCVVGFVGLAIAMQSGLTSAFDKTVLMAMRTSDSSQPIGPVWLQEAARDVTALGSYAIVGAVTVALIGYLSLQRQYASAALVAACIGGGMIASTVLKSIFDRPRPDVVHAARVFTAGFPSGHATLSSIACLTFSLLLTRSGVDRRVQVFVACVAVFQTIAIGLSRLYLGLHYVDDVLAGWLIGIAWTLACFVMHDERIVRRI